MCNEFFHGNPWPKLKNMSALNVIKLCQTQKESDSSGTIYYATLFNAFHRTPIYSANKVMLSENKTKCSRPYDTYWNRVATGLCQDTIPQSAIYSNIAKADDLTLCKKFQAIDSDYYRNKLHLDRGHLTPSHINCRNKDKQLSTFTLTNAAPQFADFNRHSWRIFECVTEFTTIQLVPNEPVFILTGVYGSALNDSGKELWLYKRVKVPGYYWKAVCYPGNTELNKGPWGYAVIQKNVNKEVRPSFNDYLTLKMFAEKLFDDPPFGPDCMNAGFGDFATIRNNWKKFISTNCYK